jgi:subtilisin family serine protease
VKRILVVCICVAAVHVGVPSPAPAAPPAEQADVIVTLAAEADLVGLAVEDPRARRRAVLNRLQDTADRSQRPIRQLLAQRSRQGLVSVTEPLWVVNALRVTAAPSVIAELAGRADVRSVTPNLVVEAPESAVTGPPTANQDLVNADDVWGLGYRGAGVVVAGMDTGVSGGHPDLALQYRGGVNSWFDPHGQHVTPFDPQGHGTMTMGVMVGRDGSGSTVGTAPDAQWVAVKIFDDQGQATVSAIHAGFQWLLDPDADPATNDAPAVVNNSWALGTPGCNLEFQPDLQALRASAIVPVFAAGNYGPGAATSTSPANYPEALAVGATDGNDAIWSGSSRGPSSCGGSTGVYPDVVAPGVSIPTTDLFDLHTVGTGTSLAAPHVTGALALLLDAFPSATPVELESALGAAARDLGDPGPDDVYGNGRIDVLAAYGALVGGSIGDLVFDDRDGDGARDDGEPGLEGVGVGLRVGGPDGAIGTDDDETVADRVTDAFGAYVFDRLPAGSYRVDVDPATLPAGAALTTGNVPFDVTLGPRQDVRDADFGYQVPMVGSIGDLVFDDRDGDGTYDGEGGLPGVSVTVTGAGPDGVLGTTDDVPAGTAVTSTSGQYTVSGLPAGRYRAAVDRTSAPPGSVLTTGTATIDVDLAPGVAFLDADFGFGPAPPWVLSFDRAVSVGQATYGPEDIVVFDGDGFSLLVDGSDIGLGRQNIDAVHVIDADTLVISLAGAAAVDGIGTVADADLLRFDATSLGTTTSGTLSLWFDGSDVGLTTRAEDVDAFGLLADGRLVISTRGDARVPSVTAADEDVLVFAPTSLGPTTAGSWALWFDGSDVGLTAASENVDGLDATSGGLVRLSTTGAFSVPDGTAAVAGDDESVFSCLLVLAGSETGCAWVARLAFDGVAAGLPASADVDAIGANAGVNP